MRMQTSRNIALLLLASHGWIAAASADEVSITRVTGSIAITSNGVAVRVREGSKLSTPIQIETGSDGSLHVSQDSSSLDIGPNSTIVLPGATPSKETILQRAGRAMYSVKPRKARTFAVETPYLVSVVKGTTFSVAVENNSTAVTLLEGSVELVGDGLSESVMLQPNQTAKRTAGASSVEIGTIDTTTPPQASIAAERGNAQSLRASETAAGLDGIADVAAYADMRASLAAIARVDMVPTGPVTRPPSDDAPAPTDEPVTVPTTPNEPVTSPTTQPPSPQTPVNPTPPATTPVTPVPAPAPVPSVPSTPSVDDDHDHDHDDDDDDDDDDGNNGHGNDDDGEDSSNPGKGRSRHRQ